MVRLNSFYPASKGSFDLPRKIEGTSARRVNSCESLLLYIFNYES